MRALALALLLTIALTSPTAAAIPAQLSMELPEGPIDGNVTVPVTIRLSMSEFMCHEPTTLQVALASTATEGVKALFETSTAAMPVEARSYFSTRYEGVAVVNLTVRAIQPGHVELTATFAPADTGPCFVPGGFEPATVTIGRDVVLSAFTPGAPAEPAPPDAPPAPGPGDEPAAPDAPPAPRPEGCAPDKTCGAIGEYDAPVEESASETPGLAIPVLVATIVGIALLARRRS